MVKLTSESLSQLESIFALRDTKKFPGDERLNDSEIRSSIIESVAQLLAISAFGLDGKSEDCIEKLTECMKPKSDEKIFAHGMATALVLAYFRALFNDTANPNRVPFGCADFSDAFQAVVPQWLAEAQDSESASKTLQNVLNVEIRPCSGTEYFSSGFYQQDIQFLADMLIADIDHGYNKKMLDTLRSETDVKTIIDSYFADVKAVYTLLFADSFGIEPYRGVMTSGNKFYDIDDTGHLRTIRDGRVTLASISNAVFKRIGSDIYVSDKRQFDYELIFSRNEVVYFPKKILEYALGRMSTLNTVRDSYDECDFSASWDNYSKGYVFSNVEDILLRGFYRALERVFKVDFISDEFISKTLDYEDFVVDCLMDESKKSAVRNLLAKLARSMTSGYILTQYPIIGGKIASIRFRASLSAGVDGLSNDIATTAALFSGIVSENENEHFEIPYDITAGRKSDTGKELSARIYEYQYNVNPLLAKAEPLFGYTVQRLNLKRGKSAGWDNILIGQSLSGKELYASKSSDIKMQYFFTHNIIAGSRSGKGVMTMNILANALAAGKPIFYLDRKPDMAAMLFEMTKDAEVQQFIVNGGLYQSDTDLPFGEGVKYYSEEGVALAPFREITLPFLRDNQKIAELFGAPGQGYYGTLGDYIYFRAFMFCLGICVVRTALAGSNDKLRNELFGGNNGIVIVVDELTGCQGGLAGLFSTISSPLIQAALKAGNADEILEERERLEREMHVYELKREEAKQESAVVAAENKIIEFQTKLNSLLDEAGIYAATFYKKLSDSYTTLRNNKVAGFKGKEFSFSDVFVLGQDLTAPYFVMGMKGAKSPVFFPVTSDKKEFYAGYKGADIIRSFIEELGQEDWFLGRNPDYDYAKKSQDPAVIACTDVDGNWAYYGGAVGYSLAKIIGNEDATFNPVLFKPYLVLNNSLEENPPLAGKGPTQYVMQCAARVNETAGMELWDTVRLKHMKPGVSQLVTDADKHYGELDDGVGFAGLVYSTLKTTKEGKSVAENQIGEYIASVLGKSGEIADYVAKAMGYNRWQELIFDLSPRGLFSFDDMVNAVKGSDKFNLETRFPLYAKLGMLDRVGGEGASSIQEASTGYSVDHDDLFGGTNLVAGTEDSTPATVGYTTEIPAEVPAEPPVDEMSIARQLMFGDSDDDEESEDGTYSGGSYTGVDADLFAGEEEVYDPPETLTFADAKAMLSQATQIVIGFLGQDYASYSDIEIEEFVTLAFEMLEGYAREGV